MKSDLDCSALPQVNLWLLKYDKCAVQWLTSLRIFSYELMLRSAKMFSMRCCSPVSLVKCTINKEIKKSNTIYYISVIKIIYLGNSIIQLNIFVYLFYTFNLLFFSLYTTVWFIFYSKIYCHVQYYFIHFLSIELFALS